ncbi:GNAT family N-acetyltransferase [Streptomyces pratensis]|uniref:GNAT family N-acetyltransferase n=1 Tax=Streptomyces pratensis TaxID=1169025 RepID=UPI0019327599|nr:GNAT family N-acetyltransferase [Streptomyces pratensis]
MAERTIYLDADPGDWRARKICVRSSRWYVTVELDRDGYVDAADSRGASAELPVAYADAVEAVRESSIDRLWYEGFPGNFLLGTGSRFITLPVPYMELEASIEALRLAELDRDYSKLHVLAGRLALPVEKWLAPGERELVRGIDFDTSPPVFLKFLRGKAKKHGLRLNGRAAAGSVWVRPVLLPVQKQIREMRPEQFPGWVDRWSDHVDPDDALLRPWVGGRGQNLSLGATPVRFGSVELSVGSDCRCGMQLEAEWGRAEAHAVHHAAWSFGVQVPKNLDWLDDLAVVTTQSSIGWRRLVYKVARLPQRENHYDFRSWTHLGEPEKTEDDRRAYLLKANGYVIGYLVAHDTDHHRSWDLADDSPDGDMDDRLRPRIDLVWVADAYRRQGVGAALVQKLADDFGCQVGDVSWSTPISDAGLTLARQLSPGGIWIS